MDCLSGPTSARPGGPDAVVIGAGHNGLVAANTLADAGWDVVLVEAQDTWAGRSGRTSRCTPVSSPTLQLVLSARGGSPVLSALDLHAHGLRWSHAPAVLAHILPDDR